MPRDRDAKKRSGLKAASGASDASYRAIFEQAAVGIVHSSLEGKLRLVNPAFCAMSGYSPDEAREFHIRDITHPEDIGPSLKGRTRLVDRSGIPYQREIRLRRKDGSDLWVSVTTSLARGADGVPLHFVSVLNDISERKRAEAEANRFRAAMDATVDSIFLTDPAAMRFLYVNDTACRMLGYTREQLLQKQVFELVGKTRDNLLREYDEVIAAGQRGTRTESRYVRSDGSTGWTELYRRALSVDGAPVIVTIARDLALYDELTGLGNRRLLAERLEHFIRAASDAQGKLALALLDIERLRSVNMSVGRRGGDSLLHQIGERLVQAVGGKATARIASNHFAVVLSQVRDSSGAARMMTTIERACFAEPYVIEGIELKVGAKTGLAIYPSDGVDPETLLLNAEAALRNAKRSGERQVFYTPDLTERTAAWLPFESQLVGALVRDEFVLHYQPKVDTATRRVVGVEALIRWQSRKFGLVSPAKFIPLMEETGMILEVGAWALKCASRDQRKWVELGLNPLRIAVNVSAIQLRQRDFVQAVGVAIQDSLKPTGIDLEITESIVMESVEDSIRKLNEIRSLGLQIAIDDFGTGYSSLGYLLKLPIQALKIDRSFIVAMTKDPAAMTLVKTIISLAHTLGMQVIAEGVEEEQQVEHLRVQRCDQIQGYLVGRPIPFDEMTRLLLADQVRGEGEP